MPDTNITEEHRRAFTALTSGRFHNFCLVSCFVDGEPTERRIGHTLSPFGIPLPALTGIPADPAAQGLDPPDSLRTEGRAGQ